jgi:hypothetical protein
MGARAAIIDRLGRLTDANPVCARLGDLGAVRRIAARCRARRAASRAAPIDRLFVACYCVKRHYECIAKKFTVKGGLDVIS